jgi:hypothetical protein
MIRWSLPAGVVVLSALAGIAYCAKQEDITFSGLRDAHTRMASAGFRCVTDRADGIVCTGFLISRQEVTWSDVGSLNKSVMSPAWQGKVWVTVTNENWQIAMPPEEMGMRMWGNIVAYGDEALLREIDAALGAGKLRFL